MSELVFRLILIAIHGALIAFATYSIIELAIALKGLRGMIFEFIVGIILIAFLIFCCVVQIIVIANGYIPFVIE